MHQCSKCRESYMGTPTDGHQCFKQMSVDYRFCLDAKLLDECKTKPNPLYPGQTVCTKHKLLLILYFVKLNIVDYMYLNN